MSTRRRRKTTKRRRWRRRRRRSDWSSSSSWRRRWTSVRRVTRLCSGNRTRHRSSRRRAAPVMDGYRISGSLPGVGAPSDLAAGSPRTTVAAPPLRLLVLGSLPYNTNHHFFFKLFNLEEVALIYHFCYTCIWGSGKNWAIPCPIVIHFESEWPELSAPNSEGTPCANKPTAWECARLHRKYLLLPKNSSKVKTLDKSQLRKFITQS